jgi:hypothetical protein
MGRIFVEGFEHGNLAFWPTSLGATVVSSAGLDMDGNYCLECTGTTDFVQRSLSAAIERYFAFRWRPTGVNSLGILSVHKGNTPLVLVNANTSGVFQIWKPTAMLEVSSGGLWSTNVTYKVEIYIKIDDTVGRVVMRLNGLTVLDFTGDTKPGTDTTFDSFRVGTATGFTQGQYANAYFDNVVVDDTGWPGDTKIAGVFPTGVGNSAQWTPSVGANWDCVEEVPPSDADYITTNTVGQKDTYAANNLPSDASAVKCVQFAARAQKEGAATPQNLSFVIRSGGVDYEGSAVALPTGLSEHVRDIWVNNPATSQAFTPSEVNGMEIGIKAIA